jgi:hypothetical protein
MKYAKLMIALAMTMVPMLATAQLKSSDRVVTQVPFEFVVANKVIPAGQCIVQAASMDMKTILIRDADATVGLFSTISPVESGKAAGNYALVFHKYGDRNFLWGLKVEGSTTMYRLPETKAEAELRAQNVPVTETTLLASLK